MSYQPVITVYLPTKNRINLLKRAITSVQAQTFTDWQLIIVNDASTDGTAEYLDTLSREDHQIQVIHNSQSIGSCASRNLAIAAAKGKFVTGIDDDDEFLPKRLEKMLEAYSEHYAYVATGAYWVTRKKKNKILATDKILSVNSELYKNNAGNQVLTTKEKMMAIGGFDTNLVSLQDYECFFRLILKFGEAKRIGEPLMNLYVDHGRERISSNSNSEKGFDQFLAKHQKKMRASQKYSFAKRRLARMKKSLSFNYFWYAILEKSLRILGK